MLRQRALEKLQFICERLDAFPAEALQVQPLTLYVFGSVLTDKPKPADLDLALVFRNLAPVEIVAARLVGGRRLPGEDAIVHLRRGMQRINMTAHVEQLDARVLWMFPDGQGIRLLWRPGFDWRGRLQDIADHPAAWPGPRPEGTLERQQAAWDALGAAEQDTRLQQALWSILLQELPGEWPRWTRMEQLRWLSGLVAQTAGLDEEAALRALEARFSVPPVA